MNRYLLHFRVFNSTKVHDVWIKENGSVSLFLEDILKSWNVDDTSYEHFFYHGENAFVVDVNKTWKKNHILPGDHLILL